MHSEKKFLAFSQDGYSLTEVMIASGLFIVVLGGVFSAIGSSTDMFSRLLVQEYLLQSKGQIISALQREDVWEATVKAPENTSLKCAVEALDPCAPGEGIKIKSASGNILFDGQTESQGFSKSGRACQTFPSEECPYRLHLTWEDRCLNCYPPIISLKAEVKIAEGFGDPGYFSSRALVLSFERPIASAFCTPSSGFINQQRVSVLRDLGAPFTALPLSTEEEKFLVDIDGDGKLDQVKKVVGERSIQFFVKLASSPEGSPATLWTSHGGTARKGNSFFADVSGDGKLDLIYQGGDNRFWLTITNSSATGMLPAKLVAVFTDLASPAPQGVFFNDIDGDKKSDLIYQDGHSRIWACYSNGSGLDDRVLLRDFNQTARDGQLTFADINQDGISDIIFRPDAETEALVALRVSTSATAGSSAATRTVSSHARIVTCQ